MKYDFYIHTYKDDPSKVLEQIKTFHPDARTFVISDLEDRLKNKSVRWITRWWDLIRKNGSEIAVKVDPDSTVLGGFKSPLPDADFFGKILRWKSVGEEEKQGIHGGFGQFLSIKFINTLYNQITDKRFLKKEFLYRVDLISVDKILGVLAKENGFPLVEYDANIAHKVKLDKPKG